MGRLLRYRLQETAIVASSTSLPNNSLMLTRLAGENALPPCLPSCPRMKLPSPSRRAA